MRTPLTLWMLACTAALLLVPAHLLAATYLVEADGTGDYPTIQAAITAAAPGDTVLLGNGTFTGDGNRDMSYLGKDLRVASASGDASLCIIDCEATSAAPHRGFLFDSGEGFYAKLVDVTIRNGYEPAGVGGGGVSCVDSAPVLIRVVFEDCSASSGGGLYVIGNTGPWVDDCSFLGNSAWNYHGGGAFVGDGCRCDFIDCHFEGNSAARKGGGISAGEYCDPAIAGCTFIGNVSHGDDPAFGGGAIHLDHCFMAAIDGCTFIDNSAPRGGALHDRGGQYTFILRNTFVRNSATWGTCAFLRNTAEVSVYMNIFAFNQAGDGVMYCAESADATVGTSCVFGNASDDLCGTVYGGIIYEDPLFCDLWGNDLTLHENSPCLPEHPYDELIGAHGQGCGYSPVEEMSWGAIKAMYR